VYCPINGTYCFLRIWVMHTADIGPALTLTSGKDGALSADFTPDLIEKVSNICLYA